MNFKYRRPRTEHGVRENGRIINLRLHLSLRYRHCRRAAAENTSQSIRAAERMTIASELIGCFLKAYVSIIVRSVYFHLILTTLSCCHTRLDCPMTLPGIFSYIDHLIPNISLSCSRIECQKLQLDFSLEIFASCFHTTFNQNKFLSPPSILPLFLCLWDCLVVLDFWQCIFEGKLTISVISTDCSIF